MGRHPVPPLLARQIIAFGADQGLLPVKAVCFESVDGSLNVYSVIDPSENAEPSRKARGGAMRQPQTHKCTPTAATIARRVSVGRCKPRRRPSRGSFSLGVPNHIDVSANKHYGRTVPEPEDIFETPNPMYNAPPLLVPRDRSEPLNHNEDGDLGLINGTPRITFAYCNTKIPLKKTGLLNDVSKKRTGRDGRP